MARRGENIYKRKDGRWEGRYIVGRKENGKLKYRSVYALTYAEVRGALALCRSRQIEQGGTIHPLPCPRDEPFGDWARFWLRSIARQSVRESTYANYRRIVENHLIPALGEIGLRSVSCAQIQTLVCEWQNRLASGTVQGIVRVLKSILNSAQERGLCNNPIQRMRVEGKARKPRVFSLTEQRKLERALRGTGDQAYLLCLYSGLRLGELCALRWADVDLEAKSLKVSRTLQRVSDGAGRSRLQLGLPKSDSSEREVPLPRFAVEMLKRHHAANPHTTYVFERKSGQPMDPRTVQLRFARLMASLGIHGAHMHTLRHTYATRCLESQVGVVVLSELLGHSSPTVTLRCYAHCTREEKRRSVDRLRMLA